VLSTATTKKSFTTQSCFPSPAQKSIPAIHKIFHSAGINEREKKYIETSVEIKKLFPRQQLLFFHIA
jgi:hypothetical protein